LTGLLNKIVGWCWLLWLFWFSLFFFCLFFVFFIVDFFFFFSIFSIDRSGAPFGGDCAGGQGAGRVGEGCGVGAGVAARQGEGADQEAVAMGSMVGKGKLI
jgi:hypothetical protein